MKKIKIAFTVIFLTLSTYQAFTQIVYNLPRDYIRNYSFNINSLSKGLDYEGSPYLNDVFQTGTIHFLDKSVTRLLKYNAYADFFEIQIDENSTKQLSKNENISIEMGDSVYEVVQTSGEKFYMVNLLPLTEGATLMRRTQMKFKEAKKAETTYGIDKLAKFYPVTEYFLKKGNSLKPIRLKKKELLDALAENQKQLKAFIKENKLNVDKEEDVVKLIKYNNSL